MYMKTGPTTVQEFTAVNACFRTMGREYKALLRTEMGNGLVHSKRSKSRRASPMLLVVAIQSHVAIAAPNGKMVYSRNHIGAFNSRSRRLQCLRHRWLIVSMSPENFSTIERCEKCGVHKERGMKANDAELLNRAEEEVSREYAIAQLERELKFLKSAGFLNADYNRINVIRTEIAQLRATREPPHSLSIPLIFLAVILLLIAM